MSVAWSDYKLKHVARSVVKKTTAGSDLPYVGLEAISSWTGQVDQSVSEATEESIGNSFKEGDVLFGKLRPYLAKVAAPGFSGQCSGEALVLRPSQAVDTRFLRYRLAEVGLIDTVNASTYGSKMPRASWEFIGNIRLSFPRLETQKSIADFLDRETARIDQLVQKKQRQLDLLPEKEKAEISQLVLRGINANTDTTSSEFFWRGDVPSHWTESRLKAHFMIRKRQGYEDRTVLSVYREFGVIEKSSRDDNINKTPEDLSKYQLVEPGDLVVNKMKAWQGSLGISTFTGITSPDYVVMVPIGEHDSGYMHHLLRARPMPAVYHWNSNGVRIDQWRMEPEKFLSLPVFLPPLNEQRQIAASVNRVLNSLRNVAEAVSRSIERLREHRAALITAAVTGQIDVATWGKHSRANRHLDRVEEAMRA